MKNVAITINTFINPDLYDNLRLSGFKISFINDTGFKLNENELCRALMGADAVIAGTERLTRKILKHHHGLIISRVGTGIDNIDLAAAQDYGITILNTPDAPTLAVAEHTLTLILAALKRINMNFVNTDKKPGLLLSGKRVGVVGMGRIGTKVAEMLDVLGCKVYYCDPYVTNTKWTRFDSLQYLVEHVDILTLHLPSFENNTPLINGEILDGCKDGIYIINTSRGTLIDEVALTKALDSGKVSGCGLDVFSHEPYMGELRNYSQVICTPHIASNTIESRKQMELESVQNIITECNKHD